MLVVESEDEVGRRLGRRVSGEKKRSSKNGSVHVPAVTPGSELDRVNLILAALRDFDPGCAVDHKLAELVDTLRSLRLAHCEPTLRTDQYV